MGWFVVAAAMSVGGAGRERRGVAALHKDLNSAWCQTRRIRSPRSAARSLSRRQSKTEAANRTSGDGETSGPRGRHRRSLGSRQSWAVSIGPYSLFVWDVEKVL